MGSRLISWPWLLISAANALSRIQLPQYIGPAPAVNAKILIRRLRHRSPATGGATPESRARRRRGVRQRVTPGRGRARTRGAPVGALVTGSGPPGARLQSRARGYGLSSRFGLNDSEQRCHGAVRLA